MAHSVPSLPEAAAERPAPAEGRDEGQYRVARAARTHAISVSVHLTSFSLTPSDVKCALTASVAHRRRPDAHPIGECAWTGTKGTMRRTSVRRGTAGMVLSPKTGLLFGCRRFPFQLVLQGQGGGAQCCGVARACRHHDRHGVDTPGQGA